MNFTINCVSQRVQHNVCLLLNLVAKDKIATSLRAQVSPALVEHMTGGKCFIVIIADLTSQREYLWPSVLNVEWN